MLIDDFNNARIGKPFETLGLQKFDGESGFLLRAWLPSAKVLRFVLSMERNTSVI